MAVPVLPESAPFAPAQRAWLNGFFAGVFNLDQAKNAGGPLVPAPAAVAAPAPAAEAFPWHDPNLPLADRMTLAAGKPLPRLMMAAMAQLDCGACGYVCQTYAEAVATGTDKDLTKCSPGGKETAKKLKELAAGVKAVPATAAAPAPADKAAGFDRANPFPAPLLGCTRLTGTGSEKDVRHVRLSLRGSGLSYEVGDALGVWPENDPAFVEAVIAALGARGDEWVPTPAGGRAHLYDALLKACVLTKVGGPLAELLAGCATAAAEADTLRTLPANDPDGVQDAWDVLDILDQFPSARPAPAAFAATLAPLSPRLYSISSSLKAHPDEVHLTVGAVRYERGGRVRKGVASNYLCGHLRPRAAAGVFVHKSPGFRLPADGTTPVVMVGPGTGVAPFRAFLQDRAAGGATGPNWLFFGDQKCATDFLYRDELDAFARSGVLTRLDTAFSRDQAEKVYVQHRIKAHAKELFGWLDRGAHFYVCGDAKRMALDVDHALHAVVADQAGTDAAGAKEYVRAMTRAGRYQRDVY